MDVSSLVEASALVLIAFATATAALLMTFMVIRKKFSREPETPPEIAFLFDGETLVDATNSARRLLQFTNVRGTEKTRVIAALTFRFPHLACKLSACGREDRISLLSEDGGARLGIDKKGETLRIVLEDVSAAPMDRADEHSLLALSSELSAFQGALDETTVAYWRMNDQHRVTWAAGAYWDLAEKTGLLGSALHGDIPTLFSDLSQATAPMEMTQRAQLQVIGEAAPRWFDVTCRWVGTDRYYCALPADALVSAERNLREFIQTLTQTFAHLSVGLAIFDRKRELTLFNPALGDLLNFDVEFLIGRPSLIRFLDQLRERHMMPEPKDYKTWRQKMSELEAAAAEGGHSETWPLPDGRTFRITGRPHPDGAVAFLFEDISAEISLNLEYHRELETGKAVLDTMEEAVAVFSPDARLSFANRAYAMLWHENDLAKARNPTSFTEASRHWQTQCAPTPIWGDAREFASEMSGRSAWASEARHADGRILSCRFEPLPGGATLAAFKACASVDDVAVPPSEETAIMRKPSMRL